MIDVRHGDCLTILETLEASSVDAVVCDPPYELGFMGRAWDASGVAFDPATWAAVLRVLKPGGHLVAFGAPKNYHRLACAIEDAGFEVRDSLAFLWTFGSGFPKSLDVSKAIDKAAGAEREIIGVNPNSRPNMVRVDAAVLSPRVDAPLTSPATDAARQWQGWGTALKPAYEPIVLARKPLSEKTVAANVLRWGTGALNIDATRVATNGEKIAPRGSMDAGTDIHGGWARPWMGDAQKSQDRLNKAIEKAEALGRWPANLAHDGSDEVLAGFPITAPAKRGVRDPNGSMGYHGGASGLPKVVSGHDDNGGSAARFFYCAKASKTDRAGSKHPTVKPVSLMRWLCRMVTPPGGTILDPFAGSGTTGQAAAEEGFSAILIEREAEYVADIERRLA